MNDSPVNVEKTINFSKKMKIFKLHIAYNLKLFSKLFLHQILGASHFHSPVIVLKAKKIQSSYHDPTFFCFFLYIFLGRVQQECRQLNGALNGLKRAGTNFHASKLAVSDWKGKILQIILKNQANIWLIVTIFSNSNHICFGFKPLPRSDSTYKRLWGLRQIFEFSLSSSKIYTFLQIFKLPQV